MAFRERLQAWRYNTIPDHLIGEILTKRWTDNAIPFIALVITVAAFGSAIPGFFKPYSLQESTRQLGEFSLVVTGFDGCHAGRWHRPVGRLHLCARDIRVCWHLLHFRGTSLGLPFGSHRDGRCLWRHQWLSHRLFALCAPFLTTLVTFIIGRALFDILVVQYGAETQMSFMSSDLWDFIGDGTLFGFSVPVLTAIVFALITHIALTRSRPGWHVQAVGGSRRSAHNAGIRVRRTVFMTYVFSGFCAGVSGFLMATRLSSAGPGTGHGLEILALTAAVVGGNSLGGGGRGSVVKGIMGAIIVLVMTNGLIRLGFGTGTNQMVLGIMLALAVTIDIRWLKNRHKVLNEVYVAPVYLKMGKSESAEPGSGSAYSLNNKLSSARAYRPW